MIRFLWLAHKAYVEAKKHGTYYCAIANHGVPEVCVFVGIGREAWRVTQYAIREWRP